VATGVVGARGGVQALVCIFLLVDSSPLVLALFSHVFACPQDGFAYLMLDPTRTRSRERPFTMSKTKGCGKESTTQKAITFYCVVDSRGWAFRVFEAFLMPGHLGAQAYDGEAGTERPRRVQERANRLDELHCQPAPATSPSFFPSSSLLLFPDENRISCERPGIARYWRGGGGCSSRKEGVWQACFAGQAHKRPFAATRRCRGHIFNLGSISLALGVLMELMLVPAAGSSACRDQRLEQPIFASMDSLPQTHAANVILQNLAVGSCNADGYRLEKLEAMSIIAATKSTILLLGGESTAEPPVDTNNGTCALLNVQADCTDRYSRDVFKSLADDPSASFLTYDTNTQLPQIFNDRCCTNIK